MTTSVVIGYGSIGQRHARLLGEMGHEALIVSSHATAGDPVHRSIASALDAGMPALAIIANDTSGHGEALDQLAAMGYDGAVLIEKPLFSHPREMPENKFAAAWVAYNLRFHPTVQALRAALQDRSISSMCVYAGSYLPDWRAGDYRNSASAKSARGGGCLRDLSHELDYLTWILGGWTRVAASGGRFSALEIDSDDTFAIILETPRCPVVSVQFSYADRVPRREIVAVTDQGSVHADLISGQIKTGDGLRSMKIEKDHTYRRQLAAVLGQGEAADVGMLCSAEAGRDVVALIADIERAAEERRWIER